MKWKEFKTFVESQGVKDNTEILYIDTDANFDEINTNVVIDSRHNEAYIE